MKQRLLLLLAAIALTGAWSCSKTSTVNTPLSSLEIINADVSSPGAQLLSNTTAVPYASFGHFGLIASNSSQIYVFPTGDSTAPYYNSSMATANGSIYSLYLPSGLKTDAILLKDTIPSYADSSCGMRFMNLSADSGPISVNLMGSPNGSTVASLSYKSITGFQTFVATSDFLPTNVNFPGYSFEIRDVNGNLLVSYTQPVNIFKNVTIVISGLVADGSITAFTANNF